MKPFEVWVQADVLGVRMTLIPTASAGLLETMLLKAVRAGANTASELADILGLAPRLVEGVLGDLWRAGRISVALGADTEVLALTSTGRSDLDRLGSDDAVVSSADRATSEQVAHDRLTGRVLPLEAVYKYPKERHLVVPTMIDDPRPGDVREQDLVDALAQTIRRRSDGGADRVDGMRIGAAYLSPAMLQVGSQRRYLPLRVAAAVDAADLLTVKVIDETLPMRARELATRRLEGLIAERPMAAFVRSLRANAQRVPLRPLTVHEILADLRHVVDALPDCPAARRQSTHDRAAGLAQQLAAYTEALTLTEMDIEVVQTAVEHQSAVDDMLRSAQRQIVIAVPWIRPRGVEAVRERLIAAVRDGVQVTILWGITDGASALDQGVFPVFDEIEREARRADRGGGLRYHRDRGAKSHAKLLVIDDRQLLVTSKNFLSGSDRSELGLRLRAPSDWASPVIEDVLQFLYDHTPDPATAFRLIRERGAFGPRKDGDLEPPIPLPRLTTTILGPDAPRGHVQAWAIAWAQTAQALAARTVRRRPTVELLRDGQHAPVVRTALTWAQRRMLVTSDKVGQQVLTAETCALIREGAARGVDVALRYSEPKDPESRARLDELAADVGTDGADVAQKPGMHAKVVLQDDITVLGSFNHLSVYAGIRGVKSTGEVSVRVSSPRVADDVWTAIMRRPVRWSAPARASRSGVAGVASGTGAAPPLLGELTQRLIELIRPAAGPVDADGIIALTDQVALDSVLAAVRELGLGPDGERQLLAAAALSNAPDSDSRLELLLRSLWTSGAWAAADLIRRRISATDVSPRVVLTGPLARPEDLASCLADATARARLTPAETEALAVSASVRLALGELGATELIDLLRGSDIPLPARVRAFTVAAAEYCARYGPPPARSAARSAPDGIPARWSALDNAVESLRRYDAHANNGNAVRAHLFRPEGEMSRLAAAAASRDTDGLRAWIAEHGDPDDSGWLNKATKAANQAPIAGNRRVSFTQKRRNIRMAADAVVAALAAAGQTSRLDIPSAQRAQIDELRRQAEELAGIGLRAGGSVETTALAFEARRLVRYLIEGLGLADRPPGRTLDDWELPRVRIARTDSPAHPQNARLLEEALCRDLAARWTGPDAVRFLAARGEFGLANTTVERLRDEGRVDQREEQRLRDDLAAARARAEDDLEDRRLVARLRYDRAGVPVDDSRWRDDWTLGERLVETEARIDAVLTELDQGVGRRRRQLSEELAVRRGELTAEWAEHIADLIESDDLVAAALDLARDSRYAGPMLAPAFTPWSWRWATVAQAARWFEPECSDAPRSMRASFLPEPSDAAAVRVVNALQSLAAPSPRAVQEWLAAIQALVVETETTPVARPSGDGATADFLLPHDARLPSLRWADRPVAVAVGNSSVRSPLHFSLTMTGGPSYGAVIDVADILSLLGRDSSGRPGSLTGRGLHFLRTVCSRLPLEEVIAPRDTPAEYTESQRTSLSWLLAILGFSFTQADLDKLMVLGGGHAVPMWHLISAARASDPVGGISALSGRRDLDAILTTGLADDIRNDEDLLVLATLLNAQSKDRGALAEDAAILWEAAGGDPSVVEWINLQAALDRLIGYGYAQESEAGTRACSCPVSRAYRRSDQDELFTRLVGRISDTQNLGGNSSAAARAE